jgi:hypothetical protein
VEKRSADSQDEGGAMSYDRQWVIDTLRRLGYTEAADGAERELPSQPSEEQVVNFADRYGINRGELMSRMGGSP